MDSERDVILYPSADAIDSTSFHWQSKFDDPHKISPTCEKSHRWRLIVLEASWQHGKTMAQQVLLQNITNVTLLLSFYFIDR